MNAKKIPITFFSIILILFISAFCAYNFSLKPQVPVVSVNQTVEINKVDFAKKFFPDNINISLKEISTESTTSFSPDEINNFFIAAINEIPDIKENVTGLKVTLDNNLTNLYVDFKYKGIPLGAKLIFSCKAVNGEGIFHFEKGNIGFINISKDTVFKNLTNTSFVKFDKSKGDIILSFKAIKFLNIKNLEIKDNNLIIKFKGTLDFRNWLKNNIDILF